MHARHHDEQLTVHTNFEQECIKNRMKNWELRMEQVCSAWFKFLAGQLDLFNSNVIWGLCVSSLCGIKYRCSVPGQNGMTWSVSFVIRWIYKKQAVGNLWRAEAIIPSLEKSGSLGWALTGSNRDQRSAPWNLFQVNCLHWDFDSTTTFFAFSDSSDCCIQ